MRALRRFTVRATLPDQLAPLSDIVGNLRWSWHADTRELFERMDPDLWRDCNGDPVKLLGEISPRRLATLSQDKKFLRALHDCADDLNDYLTAPQWYQERPAEDAGPAGIAYFSPEFGITEVLPQYSGGLGILAGDHLKAASDLGVPILAVGLLYHSGYFTQSLSPDGWQLEHYPALDPHGLPLALVREAGGAPIRVTVGLPDARSLHAQVWKAQVGRVPLLLLDADIEDNTASERTVTDRLYGGGKDHRLLQEMLLGIGGVRAIRAFCRVTGTAAPEVFHTNEGHAGFLGLERIRELTERPVEGSAAPLSFDEALQAVRAGTVFTTHTPVPAGIDRFPVDLIRAVFGGENAAPGVPLDRILALGAEEDQGMFNMAHMGLRLGQRANGVSRLHGIVSREMFGSLWSGFDTEEVPISSVTNGVHAPTWVAGEMLALTCGGDARRLLGEATDFAAIEDVPADVIWRTRRELRGRLVGEVRRRVRISALQRGAGESEIGWTDSVLDRDVLTVGFARRVPSYKRLTLMLRDPQRLRDLLLDPDRPIQLVIAGKSHPADDGGKELIQQIVAFSDDPEVRHRLVFLPDYDIGMARYLYWGCDVWLNNPLRPLEACGTSGMKSALNGGLNLSIRDGWWDEWYDGENGWAIGTADGVLDADRRDDIEAGGLYDLLGKQVTRRFYDRDAAGVPGRWVEMVRHTLSTLGPKVLATRMVRDYVDRLYAPAAAAATSLATEDFAGARTLAAWRGHLVGHWPGVRVAHVESSGEGDAPELGSTLTLRAEVELPGLQPEDVHVQAAYGPADDTEQLHDVQVEPMRHVGVEGSRHRYEAVVPLERTGDFGYTVRVLPRNAALLTAAELGLVVSA